MKERQFGVTIENKGRRGYVDINRVVESDEGEYAVFMHTLWMGNWYYLDYKHFTTEDEAFAFLDGWVYGASTDTEAHEGTRYKNMVELLTRFIISYNTEPRLNDDLIAAMHLEVKCCGIPIDSMIERAKEDANRSKNIP
jgi:hypothetical protein